MRINLHKIGYPLLLVATLISYIETLYPLAAILKIAAYSMLSSPHHKIHISPAAKVIAVLFSAALLVTTDHSQTSYWPASNKTRRHIRVTFAPP